jgi:hypothetical protein
MEATRVTETSGQFYFPTRCKKQPLWEPKTNLHVLQILEILEYLALWLVLAWRMRGVMRLRRPLRTLMM